LSFEHRRDLPAIPALYFVLNERLDVLYIGQTGNLRDRWKSHHRAQQMVGGQCRIHWRAMPDEAERLAAERQCIAYFRPPWNQREVPVTDFKQVEAYLTNVARYMGIDPRQLVCQILTVWANNRAPSSEGEH
jgi:excinuclease UvrABC nuclease subunit